MAESLVCETQNLLLAVGCRWNPGPSRIFSNARLISFFLSALSRSSFCRVRASVCEAKLRPCVKAWSFNSILTTCSIIESRSLISKFTNSVFEYCFQSR